MVVVIFETVPTKRRLGSSLDIASLLETEFKKIDGFISIERFSNMVEEGEGKILVLSYWLNEETVNTWQEQESQRLKQGRSMFSDYRIRIAHISSIS